jgi:hypothetical protein
MSPITMAATVVQVQKLLHAGADIGAARQDET